MQEEYGGLVSVASSVGVLYRLVAVLIYRDTDTVGTYVVLISMYSSILLFRLTSPQSCITLVGGGKLQIDEVLELIVLHLYSMYRTPGHPFWFVHMILLHISAVAPPRLTSVVLTSFRNGTFELALQYDQLVCT